MKRLIIRNFGPISEVELNLKRVNLFIGPQSSGKSTVLKVTCFCEWLERQIIMTQDPEKYCNASFFVANLVPFHRLDGFMHEDSYIAYENDAVSFEYDAKKNRCDFSWGSGNKRWTYKRTKIAYVPAERNLVTAIPNWYQISMENNNVLDFMKEWEFARKTFISKEQIMGLPFAYRYNAANMSDRLVMEDGKELSLANASSGLQSMVPLFVVMKYLTGDYFNARRSNVEETVLRAHLEQVVSVECSSMSLLRQKDIVDGIMTPYRTDMFIEEPEAHIFPSTQKEFVYSLVDLLNDSREHSCVIATHSPYIMTSFNNLIQAGETAAESREKAEKVAERFQKRQLLRYDDVAAFAMQDGKATSIMDDELKMISAGALDCASQEISDDFKFLLEI